MADFQLTTQQNAAVDYATDVKRRIVAVTGEAGSGKTTIMKMAVERLRANKRTVALAAPTGRAARRIYEATGIAAVTIHKLLEYGKPEIDPITGQPKTESSPSRHRDNPLEFQDVFVDEYAMVNEEIHGNLINALPNGGRLIVFGDVNQLPPIEGYEIIKAKGKTPFQRLLELPSSITLDVVHRQAADSGVLENAHRVSKGQPVKRHKDFDLKITEYPLKALREHLYDGPDYTLLTNQIISPGRKGPLGVHALNEIIQTFYDSQKDIGDRIELPRNKWEEKNRISVHVGDKVICNENTYDMRDFFERFTRWKNDTDPEWDSYIPCPDTFKMLNGEIGLVNEVLPDGSISIDFGDRTVHLPINYRDYIPKFNKMINRDPRKSIDLAYAVTTHKTQGSEFDQVCYIMHSSLWYNMNRNNIYTGITRAKQRVVMITDTRTWQGGQKLTAQEKQKILDARKKEMVK